MALDVHKYKDGKMGRLLFQINDKALPVTYRAFELLRKRSNRLIDPYGDIIIDDNIEAAIKALAETGSDPALTTLLECCAQENIRIIFVAD